jgi:formate hydrogenlyase transcriptional activator
MSRAVSVPQPSDRRRYEALLRLSEALSSCRDPEELTKILSEQMRGILDFLQFYIVVYKENSTEVEWAVLGQEKSLVNVYADVPVQARPSWQAYATQEPFHIADWKADERVPPRLKQGLAAQGVEVGPLVFVPLTTPHRRLGALGMSGAPGTFYDSEDICFLQLIGRVVAFAIDDNFNLRQAEAVWAELQRQNDRLQRSENELRELIERIPGMAWTSASDGSNTFVNRLWSEFTGLSLGETAGSGWQVAVHPDDLERVSERWRASVAAGEPFENEMRFRHAASGEYRWFLARGVPLLDEHGDVLRWYGIATDIEDRKRTEQVLAVQNARLQLLLELTKRITSTLELRDVLRAVSASVREALRADAVGVAFFDKATDKSRIYAVDFPEAKGFVKEELVVTPGLAFRRAWESSQPVILNTNDPAELGPEIYGLVVAEGLNNHCLIPLVSRGRTVGVLIITRKAVSFTNEDVDFLSEASGQIAIAVEKALAYWEISQLKERLAQEKLHLELHLNLTTGITSSLELREVLRSVAANIRKAMHADGVAISLPDAASGKFRVLALDFPHGKGVIKEELRVTPSVPAQKAMDTLKPVVFQIKNDDELYSEVHELAAAEGLRAFCSIPLVNRNRALGILSVLRTSETPFTPEDVDFLARASGQIAIAVENALAYAEISRLKEKLAQEKLYLEEEIRSEMDFEQIVGNSPVLRRVLQVVETVAPTDSTVLLLGETGTGKELIARAIHDRSRRKERTFVKLNCAAIPTGLLESELFGHERGAFTGAISQKIGRLETADQGTLFLDEVGDIPIEIQPKLLRALQEREFERLGSTYTRKVNIRLIAATNRDLDSMVAKREFRSDLFYRLNVFPIRIPPLRERREDIPLLVSFFAQKFAKQMQKRIDTIPVATMKGLTVWEWPGNIRELENFIERAVILTRGRSLEAPLSELWETNPGATAQVEPRETDPPAGEASSARGRAGVAGQYAAKQRDEIVRALTACMGRVGGADGAAARLGINRTTLLSRMKKLGIYAKQYS